MPTERYSQSVWYVEVNSIWYPNGNGYVKTKYNIKKKENKKQIGFFFKNLYI